MYPHEFKIYVEILLESDVDFAARDKDGNSAAEIAAYKGREKFASFINNHIILNDKYP